MFLFFIIPFLAAAFSVAVLVYNRSAAGKIARNAAGAEHNAVTGIMPGAESIYLPAEGPRAVLMIHGFNGSPQEFGRLPERLHQAGCSVAVPLLPGHGRTPWDMAVTSPEDWLEQVKSSYTALRREHESVSIIGMSLGAALSILVTSKQTSNPVERLVLLAPFFRVKQRWIYFLPLEVWLELLSPFVPFVQRLKGLKPVLKDADKPLPITHYEYLPTQTLRNAFKTARQACHAFEALKTPTLILHSRKDLVTDYNAAHRLVQARKSDCTRLVTLENSNHVILLDYDAEIAEQEIIRFLAAPAGAPFGT